MQTDNRLLDDLARMANGAINTFSGLREEIEGRMRERVENWLTEMDMVPREEFEAIKDVARTARAEQEQLAAKVAELERQVNDLVGRQAKPKKPAVRRRTTKAKPSD